jgi:hypothetical protein
MKKEVFRSFLFLAFIFIFSAFVFSQQVQPKSYNLGETLTYEGKFSKIIKGIAVADMSFKVENAANGKDYLITSEAKSKGTLIKLFRFSFLQQMRSTVDASKLQVLKSVKHDVQNERIRDSEAIFDYESKKVTYTETDPNDAMRAPRKVASEIETNTQDFITGLYSLRAMPLAVGKTFEITISDSGLVYKVPVRVTARVQQKSILGKLWCFRLEPEVFGENRLIGQKGSMIIWITDDNRRIPVRGQINATIGRVEIKLKSVSYTPKTS